MKQQTGAIFSVEPNTTGTKADKVYIITNADGKVQETELATAGSSGDDYVTISGNFESINSTKIFTASNLDPSSTNQRLIISNTGINVSDQFSGSASLDKTGVIIQPTTANFKSSLGSSVLTANRSLLLPDKSGTLATLADISVGGSSGVSSVNGQTGVVTLTKNDVGLSNVDNTSDANKPISTAVQVALNNKVNKSGDSMTGDLLLSSTTPINALSAAPKSYVDNSISEIQDYMYSEGKVSTPITNRDGLEILSTNVYEACKRTTTDGSNINVWLPDAIGSYPYVWVLDFVQMAESRPEYFKATDLKNNINWIISKSNLTNNYVPDHIGLNGTPYFTPGLSENWGSRPALDANNAIIHLAYLYFKKTGDKNYINSIIDQLYKFVDLGIPYNPTTKLVYVDPSNWFVSYGFHDSIKVSGDVLVASLFSYRSYSELAEMYVALGRNTNAKLSYDKAMGIKNGVNSSSLYDSSTGLYKAGTVGGQQKFVWGSALATYLGVSSYEKSITLAQTLNTTKPTWMYQGGIRHVRTTDEFSIGSAVWDTYYNGTTAAGNYGEYQNGAYWANPSLWVSYTLSLIDNKAVNDLNFLLFSRFNSDGVNAPYECWNVGYVKTPRFATSLPGVLLTTNKNVYTITNIVANGNNINTGNQISFVNNSNDYGIGTPNLSGVQIFTAGSDQIRFGHMTSGVFTERGRFDGSGNLGIGTTTPSSKLDVNGNINATSFVKSGGTSSQFLKADGSVDGNTYVTSSSIAGKANLTGGNTFSGNQTINGNVNLASNSIIGDSATFNVVNATGFKASILTVATSTTLTSYNYTILANATSSNIVLTLPDAASNLGQIIVVKKIDASVNTVTIDGNGSETIDGQLTQTIATQNDSLTLHCNGTSWYIL